MRRHITDLVISDKVWLQEVLSTSSSEVLRIHDQIRSFTIKAKMINKSMWSFESSDRKRLVDRPIKFWWFYFAPLLHHRCLDVDLLQSRSNFEFFVLQRDWKCHALSISLSSNRKQTWSIRFSLNVIRKHESDLNLFLILIISLCWYW